MSHLPGIPGSQRLLRFSAWFQAAMFGLFVLLGFLVPHHSLIITAWMATLGALLAAVLLIPHLRRDRWRSLLGLLASLLCFVGWGSWIVAWWQYGTLDGSIINITWFLAVVGVILHVSAARKAARDTPRESRP